MPSVKDQETADAIALEYISNGRDKAQAMRTIGYAESSCKSGKAVGDVYGNLRVKEAIARIDAKTRSESVASRKQRQSFWSDTMDGTLTDGQGKAITVSMTDKLRASELLGRSEADFTDNINTVTDTPRELTGERLIAAQKLAIASNYASSPGPRLAEDSPSTPAEPRTQQEAGNG